MRYNEYAPDEIHHHDHLDTHLVKVLRALLKAKQADSDYYGWVGAALMDPDHNIVFGINHQDGEGKRYHAEPVAVDKYIKQHGSIPDGSILLTTCSPCNEPMDERHGESCKVFLNHSGIKKVYCGYLDPSQTSDEPRDFTLEETRNAEIRELCKQLASNFLDPETQGIEEAFDQPYNMKWEKSEADDDSYDALVKLPDGSNLNIMFNQDYDDEGEGIYSIEFWRNNSQDVTGEGDAQRIFATVLNAIQQFIQKHRPNRFYFSASKEVDMDADNVEKFNPESRAKLYNRLLQRYAGTWGYNVQIQDQNDIVRYELTRARGVAENFADGKNPGRKGLSKRMGVNTKASVSTLRNVAKHSSGEKQRMAHWLANMKSGRAKAK